MIFPDILSINVLPEDIEASRKYQKDRNSLHVRSENCPIAQSLKRQLPGDARISVMPWAIHIEYENFSAFYDVTNAIRYYIEKADKPGWSEFWAADNVEPWNFETPVRSISAMVNGKMQEIFIRASDAE